MNGDSTPKAVVAPMSQPEMPVETKTVGRKSSKLVIQICAMWHLNGVSKERTSNRGQQSTNNRLQKE
jgi:hypothetical protein